MSATVSMPGLLNTAFAGRHKAKRIARLAEATTRAAQHWLAGTREPSAATFIKMARESQELRAELMRLLGDFDAKDAPLAAGAVAETTREDAGALGGSGGPHDVTEGRW